MAYSYQPPDFHLFPGQKGVSEAEAVKERPCSDQELSKALQQGPLCSWPVTCHPPVPLQAQFPARAVWGATSQPQVLTFDLYKVPTPSPPKLKIQPRSLNSTSQFPISKGKAVASCTQGFIPLQQVVPTTQGTWTQPREPKLDTSSAQFSSAWRLESDRTCLLSPRAALHTLAECSVLAEAPEVPAWTLTPNLHQLWLGCLCNMWESGRGSRCLLTAQHGAGSTIQGWAPRLL